MWDGKCQWTAADGSPQPEAFSTKYSSANPFLSEPDASYRRLARGLREGTCIRCHTPNNSVGMDRPVLLQTPVHTSGEIQDILNAVRAGDMPQDNFGLRQALDPQPREARHATVEQFLAIVYKADI